MSRPLLCETVTATSMTALVRAREASTADLVELRLDGIPDVDVAAALDGRRQPAIVTCRPSWEGGRFEGSEPDRQTILRQALDAGAEFVDVEWKAGFEDLVARHTERIVLSLHDFHGIPADLAADVAVMRATGAGTVKVAVTPASLCETLPLVDLTRGGRTIAIGMGPYGVVSRILAARFGSCWTYAGHAVAPGQIPVARMIQEFRFRETGPGTRLFGVVSRDASHSLSPAMHNAAFAAVGIDAVYVPLSAASFDDFTRFGQSLGIEGASVTIPFKIDALQAAATADGVTHAVGAANTLRRVGNTWEARNTDVDGFLEPIAAALPGSLRGLRAAVLGAGGAARAVVMALRDRGALVTVHARRGECARALAEVFGVSAGAWPPAPASWDLLVNTTPLGGPTQRDDSPLPGGPFDGRLVYDITYGRGESRLVRDARAAGCQTVDGFAMLVAQAERQFTWWTGQTAPAGVMRAAAERRAGMGVDGSDVSLGKGSR